MHPELIEAQTFTPWDWKSVFRPWAEDAQEIISTPDKIAHFMSEIQKLQEPELAAIRERNRLRAGREASEVISNAMQETVRAQLISIVA
jgi:hypothetical protein